MLRDHLSRRAWDALERTARGRRAALKARGAAALWAKGVRRAVAEALDLGDLAARPLKIRRVSRFEQPHLTVENVLFESLDGWSVNGSVFVPRDPLYAPPYPAVVVPCGHSTKTGPNYQGVCQVLARAGWIAITFDPPGQGTEKDPGNDHFRDAPRGYAVGWNAQRFFVADALRAIDYLSTRPDVDRRPGFALTGVSGGGHTTMWAALMDRRIRLAAPVCCATRLSAHPVRDGYAGCAEGFSIGRCRAGLDDVDLMAALAPIPQLFMAGARDEVMTAAMSRELADDVARAYGVAGVPEAFEFRLMPGGHEYTPAMARYFVEFAERRWLGRPGGRRIAAFEEDPALIPAEQLLCRPAPEPNMRTLCAARAAALRRSRPPIDSNAAARRAVARVVPGLRSARFEAVRRGDRQIAWCSKVEELLFRHETDIFLPATALWPLRPKPWPALVMFDDTGRWSALRQSGWLAAVSRFLDRETDWAPAVVSVDLRGWGDSRVAPTAYDLAGWSGSDRAPVYLAAGLDDGLLGQRVRDGVASIRWVMEQPGIDARRVVVAGRGLGAVVALMSATAVDGVAGVVYREGPVSIEAAVGADPMGWSLDIFQPNLLRHLDIPGLIRARRAVFQIDPRDGAGVARRRDDPAALGAWLQKIWAR